MSVLKSLLDKLISISVSVFYKYLHARTSALKSSYFTNYLRNAAQTCGEHLLVAGEIEVTYPKRLYIGNRVKVGKNCKFNCRGCIVIGDSVVISDSVTISSSEIDEFTGGIYPKEDLMLKPVMIGEGAFIEQGVKIRPGVTIGDNAIVRTGGTVVSDVAPNTVLAHSPADLVSTGRKIQPDLVAFDRRDQPKIPKEVSKVFILSTGRSGSNAIARILDQNETVLAAHETFYHLIEVDYFR